MYANLQTRLEANSKRVACGCRLWTGNVNNSGYPRFNVRVEGKVVSKYAHRAYFEIKVGPIGEGLELDHKCVTPRCIEPAPLEQVTTQENIRRRDERPRQFKLAA